MEDNNRLLEQRTNTALGQIAALAQRVDRSEAGPSDRPDPMEISLQILQDIATEIANLREAQCRTLLILCQSGSAIVAWDAQPVWVNPDHEESWLEIDNCIVASEMPLALARNLLLAILEARRQKQGFFDVGEWIRAHG